MDDYIESGVNKSTSSAKPEAAIYIMQTQLAEGDPLVTFLLGVV
jgi:hypothetical protein